MSRSTRQVGVILLLTHISRCEGSRPFQTVLSVELGIPCEASASWQNFTYISKIFRFFSFFKYFFSRIARSLKIELDVEQCQDYIEFNFQPSSLSRKKVFEKTEKPEYLLHRLYFKKYFVQCNFLPPLPFIWSNIFTYSESLGNFGANQCFGFPFQIQKKC